GAHTCTNHTVPYGTALWGGAVPGTSCQATIAPSLRDISQQALASASRPIVLVLDCACDTAVREEAFLCDRSVPVAHTFAAALKNRVRVRLNNACWTTREISQ